MSKQSKSPAPTASTPTSRPAPRETTPSRSATVSTQEQIAVRAYEIFVARGQQHGRDLEDWLQAESELRLGRQ